MQKGKRKVLILPAPEKAEESWKYTKNIEVLRGKFKNIEFRFNDHLVILHKGIDLRKYDFIWLTSLFKSRGMSRAISIYLDHYQIPHTNIAYGEGSSKLVDLTHFEINNLPIPHTFFQKKSGLLEKVDEIAKLCGFPLIIKAIKGSRGKNCFLINSKSKLIKKLNTLPKSASFVFQKFIPNDFDWGVIVANGEVVSAERSFRSKGKFRNNACHGAREEFENIENVDQIIKSIAIKACKILDLDWARADIVVDKNTNEPFLLEVNRFPGMTVGTTEEKAFHEYLEEKMNL